MVRKKFILFFCLSFLVSICFSNTQHPHNPIVDKYSFKQITSEQGLPGTNLRHQIQDQSGLMWFCIEAEGLCLYDGHNYTLFSHDPNNPHSITSNYPNMIAKDSLGMLWIATDHGLNKLNPHTRKFEHFFSDTTDTNSIPHNICHSVFIDSDGTLWAGTVNGLARKDKSSSHFTRFFHSPQSNTGKANFTINRIIECPEGIIWLATLNGIVKFNKKTEQYQKISIPKDSEIDNEVFDLLLINNKLWVASLHGLFVMDIETLEYEAFKFKDEDKNAIADEGFVTLMHDKEDKIWAGTLTRGLFIFDHNNNNYEWIRESECGRNTLRSNHIRYLYEDKMGLIWIGTKYGGVFQYNDNQNLFKNWPSNHQHLSPYRNLYLLTICTDTDGNYWLGSKYDGLIKINKTTGKASSFTQNSSGNTLKSNRIEHVLYDQNQLWIATSAGINLLDLHNNIFFNIDHDVHTNFLFKDSRGLIWAATRQGAKIIQNENQQYSIRQPTFQHSFFNMPYDILRIFEDKSGTLWFTTRYNGLHTFNPSTKHYNTPEWDLNMSQSRSIFEDSRGKIWISTKTDGVVMIEKEDRYRVFNTRHGMAGNMILSIQEDVQGNIWFGSNHGISKLAWPDTVFYNYNADNGLLSNIAEINASFSFETGELLFGGNNGFNVFNPQSIGKNQNEAWPLLTSFKVNQREVLFSDTLTDELVFRHNDNFISFEYTLSDYHNPHNHQYSVMLQGIENEWSEPSNRHYTTYANLPPGHYTFWIKNAKQNPNTNEQKASISFSIQKPFFQKNWFRATFVLLIFIIIALVILFVRNRQLKLEKLINERTHKLEIAYRELLNKNTKIREQNRQIERHQASLEEKVAKRTHDLEMAKQKAEESDKLKSAFLANISHEIRTPLNAIGGFSLLVSGDTHPPEKKQKFAGIIKSNIASLLKIVEDILEISKIEAGQINIEKDFFNVDSMITHVLEKYREELFQTRKNNVELVYQNPYREPVSFNADENRIQQILSNLLNNAIKFTYRGNIELGYKTNSRGITFWVKDTGIGIEKENIDSIFDRFTKLEINNSDFRGTGIGLSISKSLTHLMDGNIWVESKLNQGSVFYVDIPGEVISTKTQTTESISKQKETNLVNKNILLIESEKISHALIHSFLLSTKANIIWANDTTSGLDYCRRQTFDLIILNIDMPDIDGYEAFGFIRELLPGVPVIAQTAYANYQDKIRLSSTGFSSYLIKPYSRDELIEAILEALKYAV